VCSTARDFLEDRGGLHYAAVAPQIERGCKLAEFPEKFAQDLTAVHSFYLSLLESTLEHAVPVPPAVTTDAEVLQRFVSLLDLAVTPHMIRDGLKKAEQRGAAEALLRFFANKPRRRREDRDKVDVIATALYRWSVADAPPAVEDEAETDRIAQFAVELDKIYQGAQIAEPAAEHKQLVREFPFLREEVGDFRHFDELIDSGVIQKVRDLKQTLDASFLHPSVLATVASYNLFFGQKFDDLFKRAARDVKHFAAKVQQDGGSIMSRVDGDVIVKQLADVDEGKILQEEYGRAQEELRHVSKLKKAVDNRRFGKSVAPTNTLPGGAASRVGGLGSVGGPAFQPIAESVKAAPAAAVPPRAPERRLGPPIETSGYAVPRSSSSVAEVEQQRLLAVQTTIRSFLKAADVRAKQAVPLPHGNIQLTAAEVEAFRAEYGTEKSFRADFVVALVQIASLDARLMAEGQEFEKTRYTEYGWKPHADALAHLLTLSRSAAENAARLQATARQRGLTEKADAITESENKLRTRAHAATEALQSINSGSE
jgi:hypothetical protein